MKSQPIFQVLNTNNGNMIIVWIEDNVSMYLILNWDETGQTSILWNPSENDTPVHYTGFECSNKRIP